jgi:magnesium transporter
MRLARLIVPELKTLLAEHPEEVKEVLDEIHPEDLADVIAELDEQQAGELLTHLPTGYAAQVFGRLRESDQQALAEQIGVDSTARLVVAMDADERADFFSQLPEALGADLLQEVERVNPGVAEDVAALAKWPEASAGGLMTTDFISISPNLLIQDAIDELRRRAGEAETVDVIFAVNAEQRLLGILSLRQMLIAEPQERIREVMIHNVISVKPDLHQEEVARTLAKYDFNVIPVVSDDGLLLGVITADDVLDVLTEEQTEDVQKMAGVGPIRDGYFDTTSKMMFRKRAPWLVVLFIGEFFSGSAMRANDKVLAAIGHLSFYIPLLASAGGNSGSQSSTLVIRGLATGDIRSVDWAKVFTRELTQGVALGFTLAVFGYIRAASSGDGGKFAILIATTVVGLVIIGCVIGAMLPILLHSLKQDPATTSTPFIATLIDALGILLYMALARWILADVLARASGAS